MSDELATSFSTAILSSSTNGNSPERGMRLHCICMYIDVVDVKSQFREQLRLTVHQGYNQFPRKNWGDLLREDERAQRTHRPITGRATQITPSHNGPTRGLGESLEVCYIPNPDSPSAIKLTFVNV